MRNVLDENSLKGTPTNADVGLNSVTVQVTDGSNFVDYTVNITVTNVNDNPTGITLTSSTVNESGGANALVATINTTDIDALDSHSYELVSGSGDTHNDLFEISGTQLFAKNTSSLLTTNNIRLRSTDSGNSTVEESLSITLVDDVSPVITGVNVPSNDTYIQGNNLSFTVTANENLLVLGTPQLQIDIGGVTKYADYSSGSGGKSLEFIYTIETGLLDINGIALSSLGLNSGSIKDSAGNDLTLTLNNVSTTASVFVDSTSPSISTLDPALNAVNVDIDKDLVLTFDEDIKVGSGNIVIREYSNDNVFETVSVSSSLVSISNRTVTIDLSNEFALNTLYYVSIAAGAFEDTYGNDFSGITSKEIWKFTTIDNARPVITSNSSASSATININENSNFVLRFEASDADNHNLTFSLEGTDASELQINPTTGELNFIKSPNFEEKNSYSVIVKVTDNGVVNLSDTQTITINILDVNEAPKVTSTAVTGINEDSLYTYNLKGSDEDGNHLTWSVKTNTSLPSWLNLVTQTVTTYAGSGTSGMADGASTSASFDLPNGLASDSSGNIYVADTFNNKIRKIDTSGNVTSLNITTSLNRPKALAVDSTGTLYIVNTANNQIFKYESNGTETILASSFSFSNPEGIALDSSNNIYVSDTSNNRIVKISSTGVVTTIAGGGSSGNTSGYKDAQGTKARFNSPKGIALDSDGYIYVADSSNNRIRKIDSLGNVTTIAGGETNGVTSGLVDAKGNTARFNSPSALIIDSNKNIYVADNSNNKIRKIDRSFNVITLSSETYNNPSGLAVNSNNDLFIADTSNYLIKKLVEVNQLTGTPSNSDIAVNPIKLTLSDGSFNIDHEFNLTVSNINDDPSIIIASSMSVDEDSSGVLNFSFSDIDGDTVSTVQKTAPSNGSISIQGTAITYTPTANYNGNDSFVLTFSDNAGFSEDKTISVTVNPVDDAPVINSTITNKIQDEDASGLIIDLSTINSIDPDSSTSSIVYSAKSLDENIAKAFIENGKLIVVPVENANGVVNIELTATVDNKSDTISFSYTLTSKNDSPTIKFIADRTIEQSSSIISGSIALNLWDDETLPSNALSVSSTNSSLFTSLSVSRSSQTQGTLDYSIGANSTGNSKVTLTLEDSSGLEYKEIFEIKVEASNDALCVENVKRALSFDLIKSSNYSQDTINNNLNLINSISTLCGATISWSSSNTSLISNTGIVSAKGYDDTLLINATITKGDYSTNKEFLFTVISTSFDDQDALDRLVFDSIRDKNIRKDEIVKKLNLIDSIAGKSISWQSSDETVINPYSGFVTRDSNEDKTITLTATIGSLNKTFSLTVLKTVSTDSEELALDKKLLSLTSILGENKNSDNIIYDLNKPLPLVGENGSIIEWSSSNTAVISNEGDVTRDASEDKFVTLTATLINGQRETKEFIFRVKQNSIETESTNTITYKRTSNTSNQVTVITNENNTDINTISSFSSNISSLVENITSDGSVKSILELTDKLINIFLNTNGSSNAIIETKDSNENSKISSIEMKDNGSTTSVDDNGNITNALTTTNYTLELKLNNDGTVSQSIEDKGTTPKKTTVSSSIAGSNIISDNSGNSTTSSEIIAKDSNNTDYLYRLEATTNSSGETVTKIKKINMSTGSVESEDDTLDTGKSYEIGTSVEIKMIGDKAYIKATTKLTNPITTK